MRAIKYIVIHCTATSQNTTIKSIKNYWKNNLGWKSYGYHIIVKPNGDAIELTPLNKIANGVRGYNHNSIHISYIGGIDDKGKPFDSRTTEQKETLLKIVKSLKEIYPEAIVQGHRDFPKVSKACPSFDAKNEYIEI
jgi:N-acetylmuramoyl-L-alanine amidase